MLTHVLGGSAVWALPKEPKALHALWAAQSPPARDCGHRHSPACGLYAFLLSFTTQDPQLFLCPSTPVSRPQILENASEPLFALLSHLSSYLVASPLLDMRNCIQRDHITPSGSHEQVGGAKTRAQVLWLQAQFSSCVTLLLCLVLAFVSDDLESTVENAWRHRGEMRDQMQKKNDKKELKL